MDRHVSEYLEGRRLFQGRRRVGAAAGGRRDPFARLHAWQTRRRAVRDLGALDDRLLADIGLTRAQLRPLVDDLLRAGTAEPSAANDNCAPIAAWGGDSAGPRARARHSAGTSKGDLPMPRSTPIDPARAEAAA